MERAVPFLRSIAEVFGTRLVLCAFGYHVYSEFQSSLDAYSLYVWWSDCVKRWKRNKTAFLQAKNEIDALHKQEANGELDVYYFDESGFNLTPEIPYAWQPIGETIGIPSGKSERLNVLAFCNKKLDFFQRTVQGYVDSEIVINFFDEFSLKIEKETVVIIDNASVHTSKKLKNQLEKWDAKGLHVKYLPTYSPELNLIEIVWRFIKYSWLPLSAYLSFKNLKTNLQNVLDGIGSKYQITFA